MEHDRLPRLVAYVEDEPLVLDPERQLIGAAVLVHHGKHVLLEEIVDRDRALVLDVPVAATDRALVQRHRGDAVTVRTHFAATASSAS